MKILYGIQGTGNGHLSRARAMAKHLTARHADVTYLFSGRPREKFFEMDAFGDFLIRQGLTFSVEGGRVSYLKTALQNKPLTFIQEVRNLDLSSYDLVLCDFEPVTAWAAKWRHKPVIGFGHQSAFQYEIPIEGNDPLAHLVMKYFAPARINIGLHWHHFNQPLLPPIIHVDDMSHKPIQNNKVLVYLPFEKAEILPTIFRQFTDHEFYLYHPTHTEQDTQQDIGNIHKRPLSIKGFQEDFGSSAAVICSAGFELSSECIQFGKKLLVKPVKHQMEQTSNAAALVQLGLGQSMKEFDINLIKQWLEMPNHNQNKNYPDVAKALVDWVLSGEWQDYSRLQKDLWQTVSI